MKYSMRRKPAEMDHATLVAAHSLASVDNRVQDLESCKQELLKRLRQREHQLETVSWFNCPAADREFWLQQLEQQQGLPVEYARVKHAAVRMLRQLGGYPSERRIRFSWKCHECRQKIETLYPTPPGATDASSR